MDKCPSLEKIRQIIKGTFKGIIEQDDIEAGDF